MADAEYSRLGCIECAKPLTWGQKHCSIACVGLSQRKAQHSFTCDNCGVERHRRPGGNSTPNRFCSMACRIEQVAREKPARLEASKQTRERAKVKRSLIRELKALVKAAIPKPTKEKPVEMPCTCKNCGSMYVRRSGASKTQCLECKKNARAAYRRQYQRRYRKTEAGLALKATSKAKRRARHKVKTDRINPLKVFDRDGWQCRICGVSTPRVLRGSYEPNAPELDHMVSLAKGGHHTWDNVQCACRSCNGSKGAKPMEEFVRGARRG